MNEITQQVSLHLFCQNLQPISRQQEDITTQLHLLRFPWRRYWRQGGERCFNDHSRIFNINPIENSNLNQVQSPLSPSGSIRIHQSPLESIRIHKDPLESIRVHQDPPQPMFCFHSYYRRIFSKLNSFQQHTQTDIY